MKFKLSHEHRYWWPVTVAVPHPDKDKAGSFLEMSFRMQFEALPREEALALSKKLAGLEPAEAERHRYDDIVRVARDWDEDVLDENDEPIPFSAARLAAFMELSWFRLGVYRAWSSSLVGDAARKGN
ncbi:hypothetical protein FQ775_01005 [Nitratireductor mangrovi]|uniref:Uncharacterized protein n=1 Tax=Nitratireductor mangrovi TaxID=2599600 RepID=A0A5B8KU17_9HYPH|nr:hypothetical protein [Nitratireductor mangrovi]QDY99060.1 hypothetical protein FQ775_01005 [Nitratireductor mangrovi]